MYRLEFRSTDGLLIDKSGRWKEMPPVYPPLKGFFVVWVPDHIGKDAQAGKTHTPEQLAHYVRHASTEPERELLAHLRALVAHSCASGEGLDSHGISELADALIQLAWYDEVQVTYHLGDRVKAVWKPAEL